MRGQLRVLLLAMMRDDSCRSEPAPGPNLLESASVRRSKSVSISAHCSTESNRGRAEAMTLTRQDAL